MHRLIQQDKFEKFFDLFAEKVQPTRTPMVSGNKIRVIINGAYFALNRLDCSFEFYSHEAIPDIEPEIKKLYTKMELSEFVELIAYAALNGWVERDFLKDFAEDIGYV